MRLDEIAWEFLVTEFEGKLPRDPNHGGRWAEGPGYFGIAKVDELTDAIQRFIAEVVVAIIDAGSEREAVMENEKLGQAIQEELLGWSRAHG